VTDTNERAIVPIVLSGGSGTRLWPLSREDRPKQFLPLVSELSLLQETLKRGADLGPRVRPPVIVCSRAHRFLVAEQARAIGVAPRTIVLEPEGRNTAPAVVAAALLAAAAEAPRPAPPGGDAHAAAAAPAASPEPLLLVLPADHVVLDAASFGAALAAGIEAAAAGYLVTFGVVPDRPETGYGYLLRGEDRGGWSRLERFVEKPDFPTAQSYVDSGQYLWNSGMFLFSTSALLGEVARYAPATLEACRRAVAEAESDRDFTRLGASFHACPAASLDYAVMEKTDRAAVVPLEAGWSDVGSWPALHEVLAKDAQGNVSVGDVVLRRCRDCYVASTSRLVAAVGLEGTVVVETQDAVLVMAREHAQDVKHVVDHLKETARPECFGENSGEE
jgi:mannose-1-phosphate guanylyltransferase/mannose-6-phosphate isomerase